MSNKYVMSQQLCWTCKKATGGCSWSERLEPVEGWNAKFVKERPGRPSSYKIMNCPEYEGDEQ